jgi:hypothetical protein
LADLEQLYSVLFPGETSHVPPTILTRRPETGIERRDILARAVRLWGPCRHITTSWTSQSNIAKSGRSWSIATSNNMSMAVIKNDHTFDLSHEKERVSSIFY